MSKGVLLDAGESLPFSFDRGENSIAGWTCTIFIKQKRSDADDAFISPRVIPPLNGSWPGFITQSESASLPASDDYYFLGAKLENVSTDEEEVIREQSRFKINNAWL